MIFWLTAQRFDWYWFTWALEVQSELEEQSYLDAHWKLEDAFGFR